MTYPGSRSHTWVAGEQVDHDDLNEWGPPNVAWGIVLAQATKTSNQASITSIVDVTGLSVTFTAETGRCYEISVLGRLDGSTGSNGDIVELAITDGSNNAIFDIAGTENGGTTGLNLTGSYMVTPSAGSVTYKVRARRVSGSGTYTFVAGAGFPGALSVKDVGPSSP